MEQLKTLPDPNNALTWPEYAPAVSMDTRLGRMGYNSRQNRIDFNTPKYMELLAKKGIKPEQMAKLHVKLEDQERNSFDNVPFSEILGEYDQEKDLARVRFSEEKGYNPTAADAHIADTNDTLLHETKHYIQDQKGRLLGKKEFIARYYIMKYVLPLGLIATGGSLRKYGGEASIDAAWALAASSYVAGRLVSGYKYSPREVNARRFAKKYIDKYGDIITTTPIAEDKKDNNSSHIPLAA